MLSVIHFPKKELANVVRCFWTLDWPMSHTSKKFRFLTDGCPELVFHFGTPPLRKFGGSDKAVESPVFLMGVISRHADVQLCGPTKPLLVKFHPWALAWLLGDTAALATDQQLDCFEVFKPAEWQYLQRIQDAGSPLAAIPIIEDWLLKKMASYQCDHQVAHATNLLLRSAGSIPIQTLESQMNVGIRRLEQKFTDQVGVSMKYFARIVRIRQTAEAIRSQVDARLGDIAYDHGFFDQAHFIREFRYFADMTPTAYARAIRGKSCVYELEIPSHSGQGYRA